MLESKQWCHQQQKQLRSDVFITRYKWEKKWQIASLFITFRFMLIKWYIVHTVQWAMNSQNCKTDVVTNSLNSLCVREKLDKIWNAVNARWSLHATSVAMLFLIWTKHSHYVTCYITYSLILIWTHLYSKVFAYKHYGKFILKFHRFPTDFPKFNVKFPKN